MCRACAVIYRALCIMPLYGQGFIEYMPIKSPVMTCKGLLISCPCHPTLKTIKPCNRSYRALHAQIKKALLFRAGLLTSGRALNSCLVYVKGLSKTAFCGWIKIKGFNIIRCNFINRLLIEQISYCARTSTV